MLPFSLVWTCPFACGSLARIFQDNVVTIDGDASLRRFLVPSLLEATVASFVAVIDQGPVLDFALRRSRGRATPLMRLDWLPTVFPIP